MRKFLLLHVLFSITTLQAIGQENPGIDKKLVIEKVGNKRIAIGNLERGDNFYRDGIYDEALSRYLRLYQHLDYHSPLNYKIGVSSLYGTNPRKALGYFLVTDPGTASDYYYKLGKAYQQNLMYAEARDAYRKYMASLPMSRKKRMADEIRQLIRECYFGEKSIRDSVPVFIINMGPTVNSFHDDYAAVEMKNTSTLFFTTRRPRVNQQETTAPSTFRERIFFTNFSDGMKTTGAIELPCLASSSNTSAAGVDNNTNTLFYYTGRKQGGKIMQATFNAGKVDKKKNAGSAMNTKAYQETFLALSKTGDGFFVSERRNGVGKKDIWHVQRKGKSKFSRPRNLGAVINSPADEESVFVTPDGKTLFFSSNGRSGLGGFDIYRVDRTADGKWGEPVNMDYPINSPGDDLFYHPSSDTTLAFFSTKRQGGFGGLDIYMIKKDPRIPFEMSGAVTDKNSGKVLPGTVTLFSSLDSLPRGMARVDTITGKYTLAMEDGGSLYIQAEAPGYRTISAPFTNPMVRHEKLEQNFSLEKLLFPFTLWGTITNQRTGMPVQAEILFKPLDRDTVIYRVVSNAQTGFYAITLEDKTNLSMEVSAFNFHVIQENLLLKNETASSGEKNFGMLRSINTYTITGVISEEQKPNFVPGLVKIFLPGNETPVNKDTADSVSGKYEISLDNTGPFLLEVTASGYFFQNMPLQFHPDTFLMVRNFELQKIKTGARVVIANILYNTGSATLQAPSFGELNKLVNLLRENPKVTIEVSGHTDNVGSATSNKRLSRSRALSVKNYLVSQGISSERVNFEGYGFDRPIAPNNTWQGRAANRRVEIEVLDQ